MLIGLHFRRRRENFLPYYLSARERQKGVDAAHAVSAASEERDTGCRFCGQGRVKVGGSQWPWKWAAAVSGV